MNDKQKIKFLETRIQQLQDEIAERSSSTESIATRIPWEKAVKGFDYPHAVKNIWVDWRDNSVIMIVPKQAQKTEEVKKVQRKEGT